MLGLLICLIFRIYHDDTIDESIICELECAKDEENKALLNNVDFCNVKKIPQNAEKNLDLCTVST